MADCNVLRRIFLRKILYRIDFQLITEKIQEELYTYAVNQYNEYFSQQGSEQENVAPIAIDKESDISISSSMNSKVQTVFSLINPKSEESDGRILKIGKTFIYLELDLNTESMNIPYSEWLADIVNYIKDNPMFRPLRVGMRKFNLFYILDEHKESLKDIFKINFFSEVVSPGFTLKKFKNRQIYDLPKYRLNFSREYSTGNLSNETVQDELAHLVKFDFDLYSNEPEILEQFVQNSSIAISAMNKSIYEFFREVISEEIMEKIQSGDSLEEYNVIPF